MEVRKNFILYVIGFVIFAIVNILVSTYIAASVYRWIKVLEVILLGLVIINTKKFDVFKNFVKPLSYSVLIYCLLGIFQEIAKRSNVAPYPYAFFSHPNSFAGFLLVFGIFLLQYKNKFDAKYFWALVVLTTTNLVFTNSLNVYMAIGLILLLKFRKNAAFGFLSLDFGARFVTHRIELIKAAFQIIKENFFVGVGLNNFIPNLVKVSSTFVNSWELQPVHNIFLLILSEVGIVGLIMFVFLLSNLTFTYQLFAILITGLNDHYWLTLQQNILLFTFVVIISRKKHI